MAEIHEMIGPMGNLTSYNVLVDRRWTCQISDYGLERFKEPTRHHAPTPTDEEKYHSTFHNENFPILNDFYLK